LIAPGRSTVQAGTGLQARAWQLRQRLHGGADRCTGIAEVRPQPDAGNYGVHLALFAQRSGCPTAAATAAARLIALHQHFGSQLVMRRVRVVAGLLLRLAPESDVFGMFRRSRPPPHEE